MRLLFAISITALALSSCAGFSLALRTPYGEVSTDKSGAVTVSPKSYTFVVPEK